MRTTVEMAREAGLHRQQHNLMSNPVQYRFSYEGYEENLKAFAELVRADEREAVCDIVDYELDSNGHAEAIKIAIRARSNT